MYRAVDAEARKTNLTEVTSFFSVFSLHQENFLSKKTKSLHFYVLIHITEYLYPLHFKILGLAIA